MPNPTLSFFPSAAHTHLQSTVSENWEGAVRCQQRGARQRQPEGTGLQETSGGRSMHQGLQ
eukprot:10846565-Alexandrium_andersonii.AAC.1